jgi:hypothetical protein
LHRSQPGRQDHVATRRATFCLNDSGWTSTAFDLAPGGLRISLSPVVAAGTGGTHRLFLTANSPDCGRNNGCNIDSQNQTGGFVVRGY